MENNEEGTLQRDAVMLSVHVQSEQAALFFESPENLMLLERIAALMAARQATDLKISRPGGISAQEIKVAVNRASLRATGRFTEVHVARELGVSRETLSKAVARNPQLMKAMWDAAADKCTNCGMRRQSPKRQR